MRAVVTAIQSTPPAGFELTAYLLITLAPEKLTSASNVIFTFKVVSGGIVTVLRKWRSSHAELSIVRKFPEQNSQYSGSKERSPSGTARYVKAQKDQQPCPNLH